MITNVVHNETKQVEEINNEINDIFDDQMIDYEKLEELINIVFYGLEDKEIIVRWSCAKGLARITERLNEDLANDILDTLLEIKNHSKSYE